MQCKINIFEESISNEMHGFILLKGYFEMCTDKIREGNGLFHFKGCNLKDINIVTHTVKSICSKATFSLHQENYFILFYRGI